MVVAAAAAVVVAQSRTVDWKQWNVWLSPVSVGKMKTFSLLNLSTTELTFPSFPDASSESGLPAGCGTAIQLYLRISSGTFMRSFSPN